jgi:hypothetical protein
VPLDRATLLFTTTSDVVSQGLVADDGTDLARATTLFTPALSLLTPTVVTEEDQ